MKEMAQRVVTFLNREEVDFLDKLGKDALFSTGTKISRAKLISWLVELIERLRLNGEGIKSEEDFDRRIMEVMGGNQGASSHQPRKVKTRRRVMKNRTKILMVSFILLLALVDVARAGEGVSLSISCTIPAIPGVNAPLIEEQKPQIKTGTPTQPTAAAAQEKTLQQTPAMIQQDNQKETSENQATLVMVKTLYSR